MAKDVESPEAAVVPGQQPTTIAAPMFYATGVHLSSSGHDFMFTFQHRLPTMPLDSTMKAVQTPTAVVSMSRGAVTEMALLLNGILETLEKEFGPVDTPFLKKRREGKK